MELKTLLTSMVIIGFSAGLVSAQADATLAVEGEVISTSASAPAFAENLDTVYSGWRFRKLETRSLQLEILIIQLLYL
tara:strand:- start:189 stop:422 length:234 start_codon:yes stop_codon:yes gene_type:complete